jgi:hypothetical protein
VLPISVPGASEGLRITALSPTCLGPPVSHALEISQAARPARRPTSENGCPAADAIARALPILCLAVLANLFMSIPLGLPHGLTSSLTPSQTESIAA